VQYLFEEGALGYIMAKHHMAWP